MYHVFPSRYFDFDAFADAASKDLGPRHFLSMLGDSLSGKLHSYESIKPSKVDSVLSRTTRIGTPENWALARCATPDLGEASVVYANGEDIGVPLAYYIGRSSANGPKLAITFQNPRRKSIRLWAKMFNLDDRVSLAISSSEEKVAKALLRYGISSEKGCIVPEQTDVKFFRTIDSPRDKNLIASCGLEQRDYGSLINAIANTRYSLEICAVSPNAPVRNGTFPDTIPDNVSIHSHPWPELRTLYNRAFAVVLPLYTNSFEAGFTALMEAMACGTPVIITKGRGFIGKLADLGLVLTVPEGDPVSISNALAYLSANPEETKAMVTTARDYVSQRHNSEICSKFLSDKLKELSYP